LFDNDAIDFWKANGVPNIDSNDVLQLQGAIKKRKTAAREEAERTMRRLGTDNDKLYALMRAYLINKVSTILPPAPTP
jgi:hypothetical protein